MKKAELVNHEARRLRVAPGNAADQMDRVVARIIRTLRSGESAELPGLGTIQPGKRWTFRPSKKKTAADVSLKNSAAGTPKSHGQ